MHRRVSRLPSALSLCLVALGSLIMVLHTTSSGAVVVSDSAAYLSAASNLSAGHSLSTDFVPETSRLTPTEQIGLRHQIPLVEYAPGYSVVIAGLHTLGPSISASVRAVNGTALVLLVLLTALALRYSTQAALAVLVPITVIIICGPTLKTVLGSLNPLGLATMALSEAIFLPLCIAALILGAKTAGTDKKLQYMTLVSLVVVTSLVRYVGMSVSPAVAVMILMGNAQAIRARVLRSIGVLSGSLLSVALWSELSAAVWGGGTAKAIAWHPQAVDLTLVVRVTTAWFWIPQTWPSSIRNGVCAIALLGLPILAIAAERRYRRHPGEQRPVGRILVVGIAVFMVTYMVSLLATELMFDAQVPSDQRILEPLHYAVMLLGLSLLLRGVLGHAFATRPTGLTSVSTRIGMAIVLGVAALNGATSISSMATTAAFARRERMMSLSPVLKNVDRRSPIFANDTSSVWLAGLGSYHVPLRVVATTFRQNRKYLEEVQFVTHYVAFHNGLIVISPAIAPLDVHVNDYLRGGELQVIGLCPGGVSILGAPGSTAAAAVSSTCGGKSS